MGKGTFAVASGWTPAGITSVQALCGEGVYGFSSQQRVSVGFSLHLLVWGRKGGSCILPADQGGSGLHMCCYRTPFSSIFRDIIGFPCIVSYVSLTLLTAFVSTIDCTDTGCFFL